MRTTTFLGETVGDRAHDEKPVMRPQAGDILDARRRAGKLGVPDDMYFYGAVQYPLRIASVGLINNPINVECRISDLVNIEIKNFDGVDIDDFSGYVDMPRELPRQLYAIDPIEYTHSFPRNANSCKSSRTNWLIVIGAAIVAIVIAVIELLR